MARATANKLYRTFVKGLVTEASPLTYPEDTSYDELNTVLSRKGSRTRRLGVNYLESTLVPSLEVDDNAVSQNEFVWKTVSLDANRNFLVVQKGMRVVFFDMDDTPTATSLKSFEIDLNDYMIEPWTEATAEKQVYQMASGKGFLFIVGRAIDPIAVEYDAANDTIFIQSLIILIRDFEGLADGLPNDAEPTSLSKEHHYNLLNQGWLYSASTTEETFSEVTYTPTDYDGYSYGPHTVYYDPKNMYWAPEDYQSEPGVVTYTVTNPTESPIFKFHEVVGRYPGNNKQWWVAKAAADDPDEGVSAGDFMPEILNNFYTGNNKAPNGHYILNAFHKDRSAVSGISDIPIESFDYRPESIAFFSGRAWYGAGSTVYFSQILDSTGVWKAGLCYQEADPTAENISDLIASDGGVVPIPEADRIRKLIPLGNGVIVIAQNGVWFVGAGDSAFAATSLSVSKVSSIGSQSPLAAIEVDETIYWWSETGIQALQQASGQFGPIPGKFGNTNITEQTIQSLYNDINELYKKNAKALFDPRTNRLMWLFNDSFTDLFQYNKCLLFDLTLQAFFLWEFGQFENATPTVSGFFNNIGESFASADVEVLADGGDEVLSTVDGEVLAASYAATYVPSDVQFIVNVPGEGQAFATTTDTSHVDWSSFDGEGIEFESYIETGYELMNDAMRDKQAIYAFCHFRRLDNSSCKMTTKWDWSNSLNSNRWSTEVEVYRERNRPSNSTADLEAFEVVTSKNKVRGSGKAIQFRFGTSERGKNFDLLGWSVAYVGNTQP
jgi:hypothetical protein